MAFLMNFSAAALSLVGVTKDSSTALSWPMISPQVVRFAVDADVDLVQIPAPMGVGPDVIDPLAAELRSEYRTEPVPLQPHGFVADVDAAFCQQVLHVSQRQRVRHIHQHHEADHLR
jgi:hypothetical protein